MAPLSLANTGYAVLGILSFGEALSGYEIRKWAEGLRFFYWSPAQSQIYTELRRLAKLGYVESKEVKQEGKPDKRLYTINEKGINEFKRWLAEEPLEPTVMKHSLALRLFFGHMAEPERLVQMLEHFIDETKERLGQLGIVQEYSENDERFGYPALVAEWSYNYYRAELETAKTMLERIQNLSKPL